MLELLGQYVWGVPTVVLLCGAGVYLSIRLKLLPILKFGLIFKKTFGSLSGKKKSGGVSAFSAMATALGGTIGTGNIAGVATAITLGGAGAIFWMWISALCGMAIKYAEVALAVHYREPDSRGGFKGGPMYTIKHGLGKRFLPLSFVFAVFCLLASFGIGNMVQVNSISGALNDSFGLSKLGIGLVVSIMVLMVIIGGIGRISKLTGVLVPLMSVFYMISAVMVLYRNAGAVPEAFKMIVKDAFNVTSAAGGAVGFTVAAAMRVGVSRGIFTNEAGMGSAPIAHAAADCRHPVEQGFWGIIEVFLDTIVVCTITAVVILSSPVYLGGTDITGVALTSAAFEQAIGPLGGKFIAISITLFAFASILGWYYYGEQSLKFLHEKAPVLLYRLLFAAALTIGSVLALHTVWSIADILNGLMIVPNMFSVLLLSPEVVSLTKQYLTFQRRPKSDEKKPADRTAR